MDTTSNTSRAAPAAASAPTSNWRASPDIFDAPTTSRPTTIASTASHPTHHLPFLREDKENKPPTTFIPKGKRACTSSLWELSEALPAPKRLAGKGEGWRQVFAENNEFQKIRVKPDEELMPPPCQPTARGVKRHWEEEEDELQVVEEEQGEENIWENSSAMPLTWETDTKSPDFFIRKSVAVAESKKCIPTSSLEEGIAYPVVRARHAKTKYGRKVILKIASEGGDEVEIFLPGRYTNIIDESNIENFNATCHCMGLVAHHISPKWTDVKLVNLSNGGRLH